MLPKTLDSFMSKIHSESRSSLKESGIKTLFICFGFLEWTEDDSSETLLHSPILMLPVELSEDKKKTKLLVSSTGDGIIFNQTLNEKLKRDFRIQLPDIKITDDDKDEFSIAKYLESDSDLLMNKDWVV